MDVLIDIVMAFVHDYPTRMFSLCGEISRIRNIWIYLNSDMKNQGSISFS